MIVKIGAAKALLIWWSLHLVRRESMAMFRRNAFTYVALMYGLYLIVLYFGLTEAFEWTSNNLNQHRNALELTGAFLRAIYKTIFLGIVVVSLVTTILGKKIMDSGSE